MEERRKEERRREEERNKAMKRHGNISDGTHKMPASFYQYASKPAYISTLTQATSRLSFYMTFSLSLSRFPSPLGFLPLAASCTARDPPSRSSDLLESQTAAKSESYLALPCLAGKAVAKESASLRTGLVHASREHAGSAGKSFHSARTDRRTLTHAHKHTHSHKPTSAGLCVTPWRDDVIVSGPRRAAGKRRAVFQKRS